MVLLQEKIDQKKKLFENAVDELKEKEVELKRLRQRINPGKEME
jgi:hypothetical protein